MADLIREALERAARELALVAASLTIAGWPAAGNRARNEARVARAALEAHPPAPAPASDEEREERDELVQWLTQMARANLGGRDELNAARAATLLRQPATGTAAGAVARPADGMPLADVIDLINHEKATRQAETSPSPSPVVPEPDTDAVLTLAAIIREVDGGHRLGAAALAEAILCHPDAAGSWDHQTSAVFVAGAEPWEREELAQWLEQKRGDYGIAAYAETRKRLTRAATLLRQPAPAPVPLPVAERPWERQLGWLTPDGECWWCPKDRPVYWGMANPAMVYDGWLLPHWAIPIPQSPQGGEVQ